MSFLPTSSPQDDFWPVAGQPANRTIIAPGASRLVESFVMGLVRLVAWSLERKAMRDLHALDDRLLADIGIERAHIRGAVIRGRRALVLRERKR